jgi:hypothetical protein
MISLANDEVDHSVLEVKVHNEDKEEQISLNKLVKSSPSEKNEQEEKERNEEDMRETKNVSVTEKEMTCSQNDIINNKKLDKVILKSELVCKSMRIKNSASVRHDDFFMVSINQDNNNNSNNNFIKENNNTIITQKSLRKDDGKTNLSTNNVNYN